MKEKRVRVPVRIDFAGGTTDIEPFASKYRGAVLNAAINRYVYGKLVSTSKNVELSYHEHIPTSSGLGTSGAMNVAWLALISRESDRPKIAEEVYRIEQAIGLIGGKQDEYAAALGGINFLEFINGKVKVTRLHLKPSVIKELENHLILIYTGKPHFSGNTNKEMIDNLAKNKQNLIKIRDIAWEMRRALEKGNLERFAELMDKETEQRAKLHRDIVPEKTRDLIKLGKENGAISAKVCGSGGGGCILFFGDKNKLKKKFGSSVIDFKFDFSGLVWL